MLIAAEEMSREIARAASEKKAKDIVILNMTGLTIATDYFIIASANSVLQVKAIANHIDEELAKKGVRFMHKEGYREGGWILLDYGDCVAHIFTEEDRQFYNLERLWADAPAARYEETGRGDE